MRKRAPAVRLGHDSGTGAANVVAQSEAYARASAGASGAPATAAASATMRSASCSAPVYRRAAAFAKSVADPDAAIGQEDGLRFTHET